MPAATKARAKLGAAWKFIDVLLQGKVRIRYYRYPKAKADGWGIIIQKDGRRIFAVDYHSFKLYGQTVRKLHYHRGANNSQMAKHRPYQGGW